MFATIDVHVDHEDTEIRINATGTGLLINDSRESGSPLPGGLRLYFGGNPREIQHNSQLLIDALRKLQAQNDDS